ncbi:MAG: 2-hydroxyacid dehydrogenase [Deltaproteobacteria bacterium]|nr:2-hydroxyacid dehydrogenase [Deltaproteobacteria bacterium]MBW2389861.1 2-hydroxyacid dehydrogenase [Deltaproteobacteria bacterium]
MKIVYHYDAGPELRARLAGLAESGLDISVCPVEDRDGFARQMRDAEVLWHFLEPVTEAVIDASPKLRLIQKIGVGVNTIDLDAARRHGVHVCNMPGTNSRAVAEATLTLMLAALRRLPSFDAATRRGEGWSWEPALQDELLELGGRCVGLVGYGAVPRILAPILRAMDADVIYHARHAVPDAAGEFCSLPELLSRADIVSLHVPLDDGTRLMIDEAALASMKVGSVLVNTARGGLIDEAALVRALRSGPLRAAALDTFAEEPTPPDNPLLQLENVVLLPHLAWLTTETLERSFAVAAENCRRLEAGESLLHSVVQGVMRRDV